MAYGDELLDQIMADVLGRPATAAPTPQPAPAPAAASTPFYRRPLSVPSGVKTAGRVGFGALKRFGGPIGALLAVPQLAGLLKNLSEGAAQAYVGPPGVQATVERGRAGFGTPAPSAVPASAPAPLTADQRAAALDVGRLQAAREALVQAASPEAGGTGISLGGLRPAVGSPVGGFFGAVTRLRGIQARQAAEDRAALKAPEAQKNFIEALLLGTRLNAAEQARRGGASAAEIAAITTGRSSGGGFTFMPDITGQKVIVGSRATGATKLVTPKAEISEADIQETMRVRKMTRDQVIERLKKEGRY